MSTELNALLNGIKEQPEDNDRREILADWLEEHDQPERAEFIRLQLRLTALAEQDPARTGWKDREAELLYEHEQRWLGALADLPLRWSWQRGLLWGTTDIEEYGELPDLRGETHAGLNWLEGLRVEAGPERENLESLLDWPHLAHLTTLHLHDTPLGPEIVAALVASPNLARLTTLGLQGNALGAVGAAALAASTHLTRLTSLGLSGNRLGPDGAAGLAASPRLASLTNLDLSYNAIGDQGAGALAASPNLARLTSLGLRGNGIGPEGAAALAASTHLVRLTSLDL